MTAGFSFSYTSLCPVRCGLCDGGVVGEAVGKAEGNDEDAAVIDRSGDRFFEAPRCSSPSESGSNPCVCPGMRANCSKK
jgi:hypothetical protein